MRRFALVGSILLLSVCGLSGPAALAQKKAKKPAIDPHVASTDPLRPEDQRKTFQLPPGFEIQLVAADPDIRKPLNIAFDSRGRLWLTETIEYPFPAKQGEGRDAVKILEDFGPDGKARKITTFAQGLNIPIGVLPTRRGAVVFSIPNIEHHIDDNGDGKADRKELVVGPFGYQDTHGMTGEFVQGPDGWIYACHGFANTSKIQNAQGTQKLEMHSGNTYRFKLDGSRVEAFTRGQVNPFGLAIDPLGNFYSADCHSRPLTMLIHGGWYESFSKPHDGLGFAPHMNTFDGHSTALCGISYYAADQYPKEWSGKLFLGDVVRNRLNAYRLDWTGSSPKAIMEDFLTTSDPWFRPVDIKLGPDGCLYFADFYNRIIGHYEVPLTHPGRDRVKGRIWRIVYKGPQGLQGPRPVLDLPKATLTDVADKLMDPNYAVRLSATQELAERPVAKDVMLNALEPIIKKGDDVAAAHAFWVLHRRGELLDDDLFLAGQARKGPQFQVHALRIVADKTDWSAEKHQGWSRRGAKAENAFVQRAAAELMAAHPQAENVDHLTIMLETADAADNHLVYALRASLRDQLRSDVVWNDLKTEGLNEVRLERIADACLAAPNASAARFLQSRLASGTIATDRAKDYVRHVIRYGANDSPDAILGVLASKYREKLPARGTLVKAVLAALQERGASPSPNAVRQSANTMHLLLESSEITEKHIGVELYDLLRPAETPTGILPIVGSAAYPEGLRAQCMSALARVNPKQAISSIQAVAMNEKESLAIREQAATALSMVNQPASQTALVALLARTPARVQTVIAQGMANQRSSGEMLLKAIAEGKASPLLLRDRTVEARLKQAKLPDLPARIAKLTQGLPDIDARTAQVISARAQAFPSAKPDADAGQKLFTKHCAACHQIANQGAKIGPQLDGVGVRGVERLLEDILDPNRNVDQAFRSTFIELENGQVLSGLVLREEGEIVVLADQQGKEHRTEKKSIRERRASPLSPMPANFAEAIPPAEFDHLLAYLLRQRTKN